MTIHLRSVTLMTLGCLLANGSPLQAASAPAPIKAAKTLNPAEKFDQAVERTDTLLLPLNKVFLYRQAAVALAPTDKPRAVLLLRRALSDIDAAEVQLKAQHMLDDRTYQQLEFGRLPTIMLMERIDPQEALNVLTPPQTADRDTAFQTLFFQRLKNPELVRQAAMQKLDYGITPAAVSAYEVLRASDPGSARTLATQIVMKLAKTDPAEDGAAVQTAFALLRLLRTDIGAMAPAIVVNPDLLSPESYGDLFSFIGDAFVASKDPEMLILGERPALYVAALQQYAPEKADAVQALPFAAPDAKSLIMSPEKPVYDANHPDPATLTPEQSQQRAAKKAQVAAQMKETDAEIQRLMAKINQTSLPQKERDDAVFAAVDQANKAISLARSAATVLDREAFHDGEVEFYNFGVVTNVVDTISNILQTYATQRPEVAEAAAQNLDGPEVQTEVGLQIAIREMTGKPPYLVPPAKPPANTPHAVASGTASPAPPSPAKNQP